MVTEATMATLPPKRVDGEARKADQGAALVAPAATLPAPQEEEVALAVAPIESLKIYPLQLLVSFHQKRDKFVFYRQCYRHIRTAEAKTVTAHGQGSGKQCGGVRAERGYFWRCEAPRRKPGGASRGVNFHSKWHSF